MKLLSSCLKECKMLRTISVAITVLCLSGCVYQATSAGDITAAEKTCNTHGGINHIVVHALGGEAVTCQDEYREVLHKQR